MEVEDATEVAHVNDSHVSEEHLHLHEFSHFELVLWFVLYSCVAFLAVTGNALVVWIVISRKRMQSVTNYFIVNLAIADALTGMLAIPFKFQAALLQEWLLPDFMCGLVPFIETVTLSVSVFTLTATSVDRLRAILYPTTKMQRHTAKLIIALTWIVSIAFSVPYGIGHNVVDPDTVFAPPANVSHDASPDASAEPSEVATTETSSPEMSNTTSAPALQPHWQCWPTHAEESWWKIYNVYLTIIQYFVPLLIIDVAYSFIAYKVWLTQPVIDYSDPNSQSFERNKKRVVKMLVIVVAVFTFCWLPYETYLVLAEVRPHINNYYYINILFFCCHWLAMSNSCLNPIIYGIYNEKFQREYKRVYMRCCGQTDQTLTLSTPYQGEATDGNGRSKNVELQRLNPKADGVSPQISSSELNGMCKSATMQAIDRATSCHYYIASELGRDDSDDDEYN